MRNKLGQKVGPSRVFRQGSFSPGLAMSRSIGDMAGKAAGVISTPEITTHYISPKDVFLIAGSDGIWDVMEN